MALVRASTLLILGGLLMAGGCGDKDDTDPGTDDTAGPDGPASHAVVEIVSPAHGDTLTQGQEVALEVSVTNDETGDPMEYDAVLWSAEGWTYDQATGTVTDLPVGSYTLEVAVTIGSRELVDSVAIVVQERHDPITYRGDLRSTIYLYSNEYGLDDEGPCDGTFEITTDEQYFVTGTGQCNVELFWGMVDWDVIFDIDGRRTETGVAGTLFFYDDHGTRYETPYEGTIDDVDINVTFGAKHTSPDGVLDFNGTMVGRAAP
jgi:hypothetical protein